MTEHEAKSTVKGLTAFFWTIAIIAGIFSLIIFLATNSANKNKTTYAASITTAGIEYINPTTVQLNVTIANTGDKPGTPSCNIEASDGTRNYYGADYITLQEPIAPHTAKTTVANVTITNEGASYITGATAQCK